MPRGEVRGLKAPGLSMDSVLFRRSIVERYGLRFSDARTSEDYGYNLVPATIWRDIWPDYELKCVYCGKISSDWMKH